MNYEKFPNLKGKGIDRQILMPKTTENTYTFPDLKLISCWEVFTDSDVEKYCLEKQKVKNAMHWLRNLPEYALKGFKKELGL